MSTWEVPFQVINQVQGVVLFASTQMVLLTRATMPSSQLCCLQPSMAQTRQAIGNLKATVRDEVIEALTEEYKEELVELVLEAVRDELEDECEE